MEKQINRPSDINFDQKNPDSVSRTKQSFAQECDINHIIKQAERTGFLGDPSRLQNPQFADFSNIPDFQSIMNTVASVQQSFAALPATTRDFFANDPAKALEFMQDSKNLDKCIELGVLPPKPVENVIPPLERVEAKPETPAPTPAPKP